MYTTPAPKFPKRQNDLLLFALSELIHPGSNSLDSLARYAKHFFTQIEELQNALEALKKESTSEILQLSSSIKALHAILYASPTTLQPTLTPPVCS